MTDSRKYAGKSEAEIQANRKKAQAINAKKYQNQINRKVNTARVIFFIISGLSFLGFVASIFLIESSGSFEYLEPLDYLLTLGFPLGLALAYLFLGIFFKRNPYGIVLTGLIIYCTFTFLDLVLIVINFGSGQVNINFGWIIKIVIIVALVNALKNAKKYKDLKAKIAQSGDLLDDEFILD